jgi:hypothetical protein
MLRIPNPVAYQCTNCGEPAVLVEFPTGLLPVHCGTYRQTRLAPRHFSTKSPQRGATVSNPPPTDSSSLFALRGFRSLRNRLRPLRNSRSS